MFFIKKHNILFLIPICLSIILISCNEIEKEPEVFIHIGDQAITYDEFEASFNEYIQDLKQEYLKDYIQDILIRMKGKETGITVDNEEIKKFSKFFESQLLDTSLEKYLKSSGLTQEQWHQKIKNDLIKEKVVKKEVYDKITVSQAEIQTYYEENRDDFFYPRKYNVFQILTDSQEEAKSIKKKLKTTKYFKTLATKHSISPEAEKGGELGIINLTALPVNAQEELQCLRVNKVSDIVTTSLGYHIFMIKEILPSGYKTQSEVEDKITKLLMQMKREEAFKLWISQLEKEMNTQIYSWN